MSKKKKKGTGKKGCLCPDEDKYDPKCCDKNNLWGQKVGKIYLR